MDVRSLYRQMASYDRWKSALSTQLGAFQRWFTEHRITSAEAQHCLKHAMLLLDNNNFTLACVGEFSRGKTELINALLFSEYGQRLLPSQPGRTTMCPTEIFYDPKAERCSVRLLPIETRRTAGGRYGQGDIGPEAFDAEEYIVFRRAGGTLTNLPAGFIKHHLRRPGDQRP